MLAWAAVPTANEDGSTGSAPVSLICDSASCVDSPLATAEPMLRAFQPAWTPNIPASLAKCALASTLSPDKRSKTVPRYRARIATEGVSVFRSQSINTRLTDSGCSIVEDGRRFR